MRIYRHPKGKYRDPFSSSQTLRADQIVKSARAWMDVTQTEIARQCGIPQQTISAWERGKQEPSFAAVMKLIGACGLDVVVTPVAREDYSSESARVILTPERHLPRSVADGIAASRRTRRAQLRQYQRERPPRQR